MDRAAVSSSNLAAIGWEPDAEGSENGILEVEFQSGPVYQYADVPRYLYESLLHANSVGRAFNQMIVRDYEGQRIE